MRITVIILLLLQGVVTTSSAQGTGRSTSRERNVGVRVSFGDDDKTYAGGEFSFQKDVGRIGRRETNMGWWASSQWDVLKFTMIRQWKFVRLNRINIYAGPGFGAGYIMFPFKENDFFATVNVDMGIDYTFGFPIQIAIDWRPEWTVINNFGTQLGWDVGIAIRLGF